MSNSAVLSVARFTSPTDLNVCDGDEPRILSFTEFAHSRPRRFPLSQGERARLEYRNRSCEICHRATVEPIELRDGRIWRNGRLVPGTGTLVGFSCQACGHEWPVE